MRSVIIDEPGSWAEKLVDEKVIAKFVPVRLDQDSEKVFAAALAAMRALEVGEERTSDPKGLRQYTKKCPTKQRCLSLRSRLPPPKGRPAGWRAGGLLHVL